MERTPLVGVRGHGKDSTTEASLNYSLLNGCNPWGYWYYVMRSKTRPSLSPVSRVAPAISDSETLGWVRSPGVRSSRVPSSLQLRLRDGWVAPAGAGKGDFSYSPVSSPEGRTPRRGRGTSPVRPPRPGRVRAEGEGRDPGWLVGEKPPSPPKRVSQVTGSPTRRCLWVSTSVGSSLQTRDWARKTVESCPNP